MNVYFMEMNPKVVLNREGLSDCLSHFEEWSSRPLNSIMFL